MTAPSMITTKAIAIAATVAEPASLLHPLALSSCQTQGTAACLQEQPQNAQASKCS